MKQTNDGIPDGYDPALYRLRHSCAHLLAQAVLEQYPGAKLGIGPPIENGFYYDFELPAALGPNALAEIEQAMKRLIKEDHSFVRQEPDAAALQEKFAGQPYKLELMQSLSEAPAVLSTYTQGDFEDLCRGPHVASTGGINPDAMKLTHTAGAYWRGDSSQPMLQRIYGTAWASAADLEAYLQTLEDAKKRDHRTISRTWTSSAFPTPSGLA